MIDPAATEFYNRYRLDFAIFGVGGVDLDGALLDFDHDEVRARETMARNARTRILVLDHSKIGRQAPARGGHMRDVDLVVSDRPLPPGLVAALCDTDTELLVAEGQDPMQASAREVTQSG